MGYKTAIFLTLLTAAGQQSVKAQRLQEVSFYLGSQGVSTIAKDYYHNLFVAGDDHKSISIVDSMWTSNCNTRPFYLLLISNMLVNADGALGDTLGVYCKRFIETRPDDIIDFLYCGNPAVNRDFIQHWAYQIAGEIMADRGENPVASREKLLSVALEKCKPENRSKLEFFFSRVAKFCV
ncbi:hypothetical protein [Taibaiella soli]|uniref:Uncharacterized protein n=1 Tax=Taibaiella soli TaxID=1649169 RepID=A0A2W2AZZ7_9BACT|nr:hypothetical protein [Taibaiella soli]PZF73288.1 hypothetical protein DN068_08955 [Taibaiella soli]